MTRFLLVLALLAGFTLPLEAATYTYEQGSTKSFSVNGGKPVQGYALEWFSSLDGNVGEGPVFSVSKLSVGEHTLTLKATNLYTGQIYSPSLTVAITASAEPSPPAPTSAPLSSPHEDEAVSELLLGANDTYLIEGVYSGMLRAVNSRVKTLIFVGSEYVAYELMDRFDRDGVSYSNVQFYVVPIQTVWMRDYGPLPVRRSGGRLRMVDLKYYPGRDDDDAFPQRYSNFKGYQNHPLNLSWEGGNFMTDGRGTLSSSHTVYTRNSSYSRSTVDGMLSDAFGVSRVVATRPMYNEGTGHVDMYARFMGASEVMVASFASGYSNGALLDENADRYRSAGYTVRRVPMADTEISTYTNSLPVNGVMLVPTYGRSTDATALSLFRSYGWEVVGIDCRHLIKYSGAIHCITITIPR